MFLLDLNEKKNIKKRKNILMYLKYTVKKRYTDNRL